MTDQNTTPTPTHPADAPANAANPGAPPAKAVPVDPYVDEELERERLEPGLNTAGTGDVGAAPGHPKDHDNSNT